MNIAAVFVNLGSRTSVPPVFEIKLELGEEAEVAAGVEIEMGHRSVHHISIVVLGSGAKHPVVEILVFNAVFESQREVQLRICAKGNVLYGIEEIRALRRVCENTPILLGGKWIQRWTRRIWSRTRWLRVWSLRAGRQCREQNEKTDQHKPPAAVSLFLAGQHWHQREYRLTDARSEISIRPSRSSHFLSSKVRSPRLMSGSSSMAWRASSIVLVERIIKPSPTRTPSSTNGLDAQRRPCASMPSIYASCSATNGSIALAGAATRLIATK